MKDTKLQLPEKKKAHLSIPSNTTSKKVGEKTAKTKSSFWRNRQRFQFVGEYMHYQYGDGHS